MRIILLVLSLVPLMTGTAMAVQLLNDLQMDAVIAGDGFGDIIYGVATEAVFSNPYFGPAPTPAPNPEAPSLAYNESHPETLLSNCLSNCAAVAAALAAAAAPPPPPPTPTQQFSSLLSSNSIGLR